MALRVTATALPEVLLLQPQVFGDARGFFMETWNQRAFDAAVGAPVRFVQDNHSRSAHGVLRGLHFQRQRPQGKLVRVSAGRVFDVAVDLRPGSPRRGQWMGLELSAEDHHQLWIPPGFAHGFLVLSDSAEFQYKVTDYWDAADEQVLAWNDPRVGVAWPLAQLRGEPLLSARDAAAPGWAACALPA